MIFIEAAAFYNRESRRLVTDQPISLVNYQMRLLVDAPVGV
jgi:hypothetical protein